MKKIRAIKWIVISLVTIILLIAFAGIYKFNYLASKEGYDCDGNKVKIPASTIISDSNINKRSSAPEHEDVGDSMGQPDS